MSDLDALLAADRLVDLTQPLGPETVLWPGSTPFAAVVECDYDTHDSYSRDLQLPEHAGTHIDAPAHFARGGATTDQIPLDALVRPVVKLDVRDRVAGDAGYELDAAHDRGTRSHGRPDPRRGSRARAHRLGRTARRPDRLRR